MDAYAFHQLVNVASEGVGRQCAMPDHCGDPQQTAPASFSKWIHRQWMLDACDTFEVEFFMQVRSGRTCLAFFIVGSDDACGTEQLCTLHLKSFRRHAQYNARSLMTLC